MEPASVRFLRIARATMLTAPIAIVIALVAGDANVFTIAGAVGFYVLGAAGSFVMGAAFERRTRAPDWMIADRVLSARAIEKAEIAARSPNVVLLAPGLRGRRRKPVPKPPRPLPPPLDSAS